MMTTNEKVVALRACMRERNLDAFMIPSSDPHQSEYVAEHWKIRAWISGFTGSSGTVIITQNHAGLWTDSRYFIQAEEELADSEFQLHKMTPGKGLEYDRWLANNIPKNGKIGCNGMLYSMNQIRYIENSISGTGVALEVNHPLVSKIWKDRTPLPKNVIFDYDVKYAGVSREEKIAQVRKKMQAFKADWYLASALDEVAWLLNLRGSDINCNPVFYAYTLLSQDEIYLFIDEQKIPNELKENLQSIPVQIYPYTSILDIISKIKKKDILLVDPLTTNTCLKRSMHCQVMERPSIIRDKKTLKNKTEIAHIRRTMEKDGAALVRLYKWLEETLEKHPVSEYEVATKLDEYRSQLPHYRGESFETIVGYNANAAIVHYRPEQQKSDLIYKEGILLLDSGGQYLDGTTDITRTVALGKPTAQQKKDFTLVLKGNIALDQAYFPYGTTGNQLDAIARKPLWDDCLNYGHGTGHGVGFFLDVHESPPRIVPMTSGREATKLKPDMVMSNEPGLYRKGKYGIRIENLILCQKHKNNLFGNFLKFETLSLFPLDLELVELSLLEKKEIEWINKYHVQVYNRLAPHLDVAEKEWLRKKCQTIQVTQTLVKTDEVLSLTSEFISDE